MGSHLALLLHFDQRLAFYYIPKSLNLYLYSTHTVGSKTAFSVIHSVWSQLSV